MRNSAALLAAKVGAICNADLDSTQDIHFVRATRTVSDLHKMAVAAGLVAEDQLPEAYEDAMRRIAARRAATGRREPRG